jgi:hypothetical protein
MISCPGQREDHNHHGSIQSLFKSAEDGCPLCTLICEFFPFLDQDKLLPRYLERHKDSVSLRYHSVRVPDPVQSATRWVFGFSTVDSLRNYDEAVSKFGGGGVININAVQGEKFIVALNFFLVHIVAIR